MAAKLLQHDLMRCLLIRCLYAFVGLLLAGSIVAFLLYVPLWSILTVSVVFLGMVLTFLLGACVGSDRALPWHKQQLSSEPPDTSTMTICLVGAETTGKSHRQPQILKSLDRI